jgi:lipopolysaccharide/colanic/teichoic acid biosynthesis glycosyltransferase
MHENRQMHRLVQPRPATGRITRLGDFLIACVLLAIALPLMVIVVLAIKLESPGPVLDRQTCAGRCGRRFQMLKFRTTVHNPYRPTPPWAQMPTPIGLFLRRTRIEALPQLINVLRGEMSIIDREGGSPSFLD